MYFKLDWKSYHTQYDVKVTTLLNHYEAIKQDIKKTPLEDGKKFKALCKEADNLLSAIFKVSISAEKYMLIK